MTTNESVIASALNEHRDFDMFHVVRASKQFVASPSLHHEYVRFYLSSLDGFQPERGCCIREATCLDSADSVQASSIHTVYVESTVYHLNRPLGPSILSSHSHTKQHLFREYLVFPIKYSELPLDAMVLCTVHSVDGIVGRVCFYPFTSRGELKTGARRYPLVLATAAAPVVASPQDVVAHQIESYEVWELAAREKAHGRIADVPWLDTLTSAKVAQLSEERRQGGGDVGRSNAHSVYLSLEFPTTSNALPVFFTSIPAFHDVDAWAYDAAPSALNPVYDLDRGMENLSEAKASILSRSMYLISDSDAQPGFKERKALGVIIGRPLIQLDPVRIDDAALLWRFRQFLVKDPKAFLPFMSCVDWANKGERTEAERLMAVWKPIEVEDALVCLSYLFQGTLSIRRHAVDRLLREPMGRLQPLALQLVQGARYDVQAELFDLLSAVALKSWEFCCHVYWFMSVEVDVERSNGGNVFTEMRLKFLVIIEAQNDLFFQRIHGQEQLKSALNTMHGVVHKEHNNRARMTEVAKDCLRNLKCGLREVFTETTTSVPSAGAAGSGATNNDASKGSNAVGTLTSGMGAISAALSSAAAPFSATAAPHVVGSRSVTLPSHPSVSVNGISENGFYMFKSAKMPMKLCFSVVVPSSGRSGQKPQVQTKHEDMPPVDVLPDGLQADVVVATAAAAATPTLRSPLGPSSPAANAVAVNNEGVPYFPIMFKSGDDVRQDQLVIQIIELMDRLLKDNGLDLCLTPYRVLATSPNDGFMELVPNVETFQSVQRDIVRYIATHNKTTELFATAMERFVKSCAGYSVVTFLLGIGDRHLENLLVTSDGRLLHIDFGFIFGNDPKPFPPPMKINKEMVDTMGGPQSAQYSQFKTYCCSAYNILRKHCSVIMSLLLLMVDASIPQISHGSKGMQGPHQTAAQLVDPRAELLKVQDKFRLDLNNAEATQYIQNVIADSVGAIFTNLWDVIHIAAQAARN